MDYKVIKRKNPKSGELAYYAQAAECKPMGIDELCEQISYSTTVTNSDVHAVLLALEQQILMQLRNGMSIRLGMLGSFHPTITSFPSDTEEEVTASNITGVHIRFVKGSKLRSGFSLNNEGMKLRKVSNK